MTVAVVSWCGAEAAKAWAVPVEVGLETRSAPRVEAEARLGRWLRAEPGLGEPGVPRRPASGDRWGGTARGSARAWAPPLHVGLEPMAARLRCSKPHADHGLAEPGPWCWHQACPAKVTYDAPPGFEKGPLWGPPPCLFPPKQSLNYRGEMTGFRKLYNHPECVSMLCGGSAVSWMPLLPP